MTEPTPRKAPRDHPVAPDKPAAAGAAEVPPVGEPVPVDKLSPEEQMALFEKELKEKDWGHQPC
jgi:hypothetical protein